MIIRCGDCKERERCILSNLGREELSQVERLLNKGLYNKGDLIFQQGEPLSGCYLLCHGAVKLVWRMRRGEKQILRLRGPGEMIALESLYGGRSSTYAKVLKTTQAAFIVREDLAPLIKEFPALGREMFRRLAQLSRDGLRWELGDAKFYDSPGEAR